ncbi:SDR family NAD(P)-dependent oxidoreductase [Blastococcus sp. URHD0036]|uniref:SDR family NAD(P)-dependent oxidoreductase n=1 Tax=Blastococcus sp. URHD0036 TaxID=1380356 RepID=UPI0004966969|nr:SDR family oxidoreductase [Blastococcus sp. URHD0036]
MTGLAGRVAVVTGAGSGIGAASAAALAREGAAVVLAGRTADTLEAQAARIVAAGGRAVAVRADVTVEDDVVAVLDRAVVEFGRLDVLHANAGGTSRADRDVATTSEEIWHEALQLNLVAVATGIRHAIPRMTATGGGSIVVTASAGAFAGGTGKVAYAAAKAGVIALVKHVASSHGAAGIRCNAIAPGLVLTEGARAYTPDAMLDAIARHQPLAGFTTPDDVADLAVFLAGDGSRFVTGQTITIDAGTTAMAPATPALRDALRR